MQRDPLKIYIGIVHRGDTRWETSMELIRTIVQSFETKYQFTLGPGGGCDVAHARNLQIHDCYSRTECSRLVWIDSDVTKWFEMLPRLLAHDVPYVGGLYPLKDIHSCRWSWNGWARPSARRADLWDVEELCTGFTAIQMSLVEELREAYPSLRYTIEDYAYRGEVGYELCQMGPSNGRRLPEDFCLSRRIHALGHEVNVDPAILVGHVGSVDLLDMHRKLGSYKAPELRG